MLDFSFEILKGLIHDPYVVDVVFGLVSLLSLSFFWLVVDFTVSFLYHFSRFWNRHITLNNPNKLADVISQLQSRRSDLCWELDQIEDQLFELIPFSNKLVFDANKLDNKQDQVFDGLHQV